MILGWLKAKPSDSNYLSGKALLGPLVADAKKDSGARWILDAAQAVAQATGGLFGLIGQKVSADEEAMIRKLAEKLRK